MTYTEIKKNEGVLAYLKQGNDNLGTMGFTDHSDAHCAMVAERAAMILKKFGYSDHDIELVKIAGFMHDMGNAINRHAHAEYGALLASQLRRYTQFANRSPKEEKNDRIHVIGGLELNEDTVEVFVDGKPVQMTPIEFKILALLIRTPGRVYSADEIYERVWNEKAINTDTIMVHVRNIRDKIEINPRDPKYLKVVWGVGYKIEKQQ